MNLYELYPEPIDFEWIKSKLEDTSGEFCYLPVDEKGYAIPHPENGGIQFIDIDREDVRKMYLDFLDEPIILAPIDLHLIKPEYAILRSLEFIPLARSGRENNRLEELSTTNNTCA